MRALSAALGPHGIVGPALLVALCAVATYAGGLGGPFLLDDRSAIVENESIVALWPALVQPPPDTPVAGRPVANWTLALDRWLFGLDPLAFRRTSLVLHVALAMLALALVRRTLSGPTVPEALRRAASGIAVATALLWSIHPLTSEVILYPTQRTELLYALFLLLTLYCAERSAASPHPALWSSLACLSSGLGMGSKEVMAVAPVLVLLHDRAFRSESFGGALRRRWGLYAGLAASYVVLIALAASEPRARSVALFDLDYLAAQGEILLRYAALTVWPAHLVIDYGPLTQPPAARSVAAWVALVYAIGGAAALRFPRAGFVAAWVFLLLAPTSSVISIHTEIGAERRMYLPLIALIGAFLAGAWWTLDRIGAGRRSVLVGGLVAALALPLAVRTRARSLDFAEPVRLWETTVAERPHNHRAHTHLAQELRERGRIGPALAHYEEALRLAPDYAPAHLNLAVLLHRLGRQEEALPHAERAAARPDRRAIANLGSILARLGRLEEAIAAYRRALALGADTPEVRLDLALALALADRRGEARVELRHLLEQHPDHPAGLSLLGSLGADP